jgi:hypothetical protein
MSADCSFAAARKILRELTRAQDDAGIEEIRE